MLFDDRLLLCESQVVTAFAFSTNVVNMGTLGRHDDGAKIDFLFEAWDRTNGDESYLITVQRSPDSGFSTNFQSQSLNTAGMTTQAAPFRMAVPLSSLGPYDWQYLRLSMNPAGTSPSMTVTARVLLQDQGNWYPLPGVT